MDFKKFELQIMLLEMDIVIQKTKKEGILKTSPIYYELRDKIASMIDNYDRCDKDIFSCHTGLAVSDEFFCKQQHMTDEDLLPAIHSLVKELDEMIKHSGMYSLRLTVEKIK